MSVHCPATLLVARHGDAQYHGTHVLSDAGGWLSDLGVGQARALGSALRDDSAVKVARVYSSPLSRAIETAACAAGVLLAGVEVMPGLHEIEVGALAGRSHDDPQWLGVGTRWRDGDLTAQVPGGESGEQVLARFRSGLESIADQHRGETVLVITHGGIMSVFLPLLTSPPRHDLTAAKYLPNAAPATLEWGDDGILLTSWPGSVDKSVV